MKKAGRTVNKSISKPALPPYIATGSTMLAAPVEIAKRKKQISDAEKIGEHITMVDGANDVDGEYENPYKVQALYYIARGLDIPTSLLKEIEEFEKQHLLNSGK